MSDDEWEYEYDQTETDTFYLTLDLTSSALPPKRNVRKRKNAQERASGDLHASAERPPPSRGQEDDQAREREAETDEEQMGSEKAPEENRLQILDLHTATPVVSYQNQFFTCNWASNVGTELLFAKRSLVEGLPVLQTRSEYSVLAASSFRLTSTPVQLMHKDVVEAEQEAEDESVVLDGEGFPEGVIPVGPGALPARRKQARFLERLMEAKKRQGEWDEVTVYAKKKHLGIGWRNRYPQQDGQRAEIQGPESVMNGNMNTGNGQSASQQIGINSPPSATATPTTHGAGQGRARARGRGRPRGSRARARGPRQATPRLFGESAAPTDQAAGTTEPWTTSTPESWNGQGHASSALGQSYGPG